MWSPGAHDALLLHALGRCGVPDFVVNQIQQDSREWDEMSQATEWVPGQLPNYGATPLELCFSRALLGGDGGEGGPALLHFFAAAVRAQNFALFVVDQRQDLRK